MDVLFLKNSNKLYEQTRNYREIKNDCSTLYQKSGGFDHLTESTDFITDLQINSANLVDVILDIEEEFSIIIDNQSMERMLDVKSAMEIIQTKLSQE